MADFISTTKEDVYNDLETKFLALYPDFEELLDGGIIRNTLEMCAASQYNVIQNFNSAFLNAFIDTATGVYLEKKCAEVGVIRKTAQKTLGNVIFYISEPEAQNIVIPAETIVKSKLNSSGIEYNFKTTEEKTLLAGETEIIVPVEALEAGSSYNLIINAISIVVNPITGIDGVKNLAGWITQVGTDDEADDSLRKRYYLAWQSVSGVNTAFYKKLAMDVTGVSDAKVIPLFRGSATVDILISTTVGVPSDELVLSVQGHIDENRPLGIDALVRPPKKIDVPVSVVLTLYSGATSSTIIDTATSQLVSLSQSLGFGQDLTLTMITQALKVSGIKAVSILSPIADTSVSSFWLARISEINISTVFAEEE